MRMMYFMRGKGNSCIRGFYIPEKEIVIYCPLGSQTGFLEENKHFLEEVAEAITNISLMKDENSSTQEEIFVNDALYYNVKEIEYGGSKVKQLIKKIRYRKRLDERTRSGMEDILKRVKK